jgi:hypothetical protein
LIRAHSPSSILLAWNPVQFAGVRERARSAGPLLQDQIVYLMLVRVSMSVLLFHMCPSMSLVSVGMLGQEQQKC